MNDNFRTWNTNISTQYYEKNCKWNFEKLSQAARDKGPNDSKDEHFNRNRIESLVRESIQNSLDAQDDPNKPVIMDFSFGELDINKYKGLMDIKSYIQGCIDLFPKNNDAKRKFGPMIEYIDQCNNEGTIPYIKVSDFNTTGMEYIEGDTSCTFYSFLRAEGVSEKRGNTGGGSFGFGKDAFFINSAIRTFLVTSYTQDNCIFEGLAELCTNKRNDSDIKYSHDGFYDNNNGNPVTKQEDIPVAFRRLEQEKGSDIFIIGMKQDRKILSNEIIYVCKTIKDCVLRNFCIAIQVGRLEVHIHSNVFTDKIRKSNISSIINDTYKDDFDKISRGTGFNPKPYLNAFKNAVISDNTSLPCHAIEGNMKNLGHVTLYLLKDKNIPIDKIMYMRKPLMCIKTKKRSSSFGFQGVFICDDDKGDMLLRMTENPSHTEWESKSDSGKEIKEALDEVEEFITAAIENEFSNSESDTEEILGLDDYLYIPSEDDDTSITESTFNMLRLHSSISRGGIRNTKKHKGKVSVKKKSHGNNTSLQNDPEGQETGGTSEKEAPERTGNGEIPTTVDKEGFSNTKQGDVKGKTKKRKQIEVDYRSFAQDEETRIVHNLIVYSNKDRDNVDIEIFIGGEDSSDILPIYEGMDSYGQSTNIADNKILNTILFKGKNKFKVYFHNKKMKYSLKLDVYENK